MSQSHTIIDSATPKPYIKESDFYRPYLKEPSELTIKYYALELLAKQSQNAKKVAESLFKCPIEIGEKLYNCLTSTKKSSQLPNIVALGMI